MTKTQHYTMRYSPKPMEEYGASKAMLDTPERWNLAYLSHDYDSIRYPKDPHFAVHVRRTSQTRLDGGGLDVVGSIHPDLLVGSLLRETAPRAVYRLQRLKIFEQLPLYAAYGKPWVAAIVARSRQCWYDEQGLDPEPVDFESGSGIREQLLKKASRA